MWTCFPIAHPKSYTVTDNLIADPAYADVLAGLRQELANEMYRTDDFLLEEFEREFGISAATTD